MTKSLDPTLHPPRQRKVPQSRNYITYNAGGVQLLKVRDRPRQSILLVPVLRCAALPSVSFTYPLVATCFQSKLGLLGCDGSHDE